MTKKRLYGKQAQDYYYKMGRVDIVSAHNYNIEDLTAVYKKMFAEAEKATCKADWYMFYFMATGVFDYVQNAR